MALVFLALRLLTPKQLKFPVKLTLCLGASCLPLFTRSYTSGHEVTLQPFYMSKYPITQNQYQAIMGKNPSRFNSVRSQKNSLTVIGLMILMRAAKMTEN